MNTTIETNKAKATRFIEAFNTDDWDTVRNVADPNYVFHHPLGGTVRAGPKAIIGAWSEFKASLPDSWHPIPVMIAEGDYVAVLLPTYGIWHGEHRPLSGRQVSGKLVWDGSSGRNAADGDGTVSPSAPTNCNGTSEYPAIPTDY
jgi:predicted SnoaL-like aldol condensation-catalyzing enzyme